MKYLTLFFIMLFASITQAAEPLRWVGVPVFYSKFIPKVAQCEYTTEARYGFCGWALYPEEGELGVTSFDGQVKEAFLVRFYDEITCVKGKCESNYGEPRGQSSNLTTSYWYIPKGFYLTELNGIATAVKYGNGPQASKYPIRAVKILPEYNDYPDGQYVPEESERLLYDVWCNDGNMCSYMGRELTFNNLRKYIPARLTTRCNNQFCYNEQNRVAGINPKSLIP